ncbi:PKD domain-containing protein, partial [Subsaximicrobium wynnwilliamsii]
MKKQILLFLVLLSILCAHGQDISMQDGTFNQCQDRFFDSGGEFGNYTSNENFALTICPNNAGDVIELSFTTFNTQLVDVMTIYDGADNTAPSLGSYSGINSPLIVEASSPSGCLTIEFVSNATGVTIGWAADIACLTPCQDIVANLDSTNPGFDVNNIVVADVDEVITFNGSGAFSVNGSGATYLWDFGDGNTGSGATATHQYATAGVYDITLTITDTNPAGCSSTNAIDLTAQIGASGPGNPYVNAGDDVVIDCADDCAEISAEFLEIGETNTYTVSQIPFVPPFPFQGLSNPLNPNIDDAWSSVDNLPFDFCFFNNIRTQFQVGSNGVISFDVDPSDNSNEYGFTQTLPNNSNTTLSEANIFTPCHDINPAVGSSEEIGWEIIGTAPNRVLAVSFYNVPLYSCTNLVATHMAVFYETTNVIDIYIKDKPFCASWNNGNAVVGIQNDAGTIAFVPPNRNTGQWSTTDEAWRFTPSGQSITDFAWLDESGTVIATTPTFEVCPATQATYTAQVTYINCNGDEVIVTDDVVVSKDTPFDVELGPDQQLCEGDPDVILDADIASPTAQYIWFLDGIFITGEESPTLTVASPNSGVYSVQVTDQSCALLSEVEVSFNGVPDTAFSLSPNCNGALATILGNTGGTFTFNPAATDGANIDAITGEITNTTSGASYTVEYSIAGLCPSSSTQNVTITDLDNTSFTLTATCDGAIATIDGNSGGVFTFNPLPADGAMIDAATGTITGGTFGTVYTVQYATSGVCASSSTETVSIVPADDPAFSLQPNCDGATATISGDTGGTFTFNPVPTDAATIDASTGTVSNAVPDATYTVEYTTAGPCVQTAQQSITVFSAEDASFTYTPSCDNAIATITGDLGGSFAFDSNSPSDGAVLDAVTGEITNPVSGETYAVNYSSSGNCPETTTVSVTILPQDDSSFTIAPTCDGATTTITGLVGGTFSLNPVPTDGTIINTSSGTVTGGAYATEYTISYTTNGACPTTTTQSFTVFSQPIIFDPTPLEVCDDGVPDGLTSIDLSMKNSEVTGNNPGYTVSYHKDQADADSDTDALPVPYTNEANGQVVFVRVEDNTTSCHATTSLVLTVQQAPVANDPAPLEYCDPDSDGFGVFDLTLRDAEITGGVAGLEVSYHETFADAQNGVNAVGSPYSNIVAGTQVLHARVESATVATGCATLVELVLIVNPTPAVPAEISDYVLCDSDADGVSQFDLGTKEAEITGSQPTLAADLDLILTYHLSAADALSGNDAISNVGNYTNTGNPQTIFVRLEGESNGCADTGSFEIRVDLPPVAVLPAPLQLCDDGVADGVTVFDLSVRDSE